MFWYITHKNKFFFSITPTNSQSVPVEMADFECDFPPRDENTYFVKNVSRRVDMHCIPGYGIQVVGKNLTSSLRLVCNGSGHWNPTNVRCKGV